MPSSLTPFISRQDLTDYLGRDVTADDGALACVDAACDIVRTATEQNINRGTTTGTFDGTGTDTLLLPEMPVSSVGTVEVFELEGTTNTWDTLGTADYTLNGNGGLHAVDRAGTATMGHRWPAGRQNVRVNYVHGYLDAEIPRDIRMIALTVASRLLVQGPTLFESLGDLNVRYAAESTALMPTERFLLRKHRRTR